MILHEIERPRPLLAAPVLGPPRPAGCSRRPGCVLAVVAVAARDVDGVRRRRRRGDVVAVVAAGRQLALPRQRRRPTASCSPALGGAALLEPGDRGAVLPRHRRRRDRCSRDASTAPGPDPRRRRRRRSPWCRSRCPFVLRARASTGSYYGTDTRAGELLVGLVLAAVIADRDRRRRLLALAPHRSPSLGAVGARAVIVPVATCSTPAPDALRPGLLPLTGAAVVRRDPRRDPARGPVRLRRDARPAALARRDQLRRCTSSTGRCSSPSSRVDPDAGVGVDRHRRRRSSVALAVLSTRLVELPVRPPPRRADDGSAPPPSRWSGASW